MSLPLRTASAPALKRSFAASAFLRCADFTRDQTERILAPLRGRRNDDGAGDADRATVTLSAELRGLSLSPSDANPRDDANNPRDDTNNPRGANPRDDTNTPRGANPSRRNGPSGTNRRPGGRRL